MSRKTNKRAERDIRRKVGAEITRRSLAAGLQMTALAEAAQINLSRMSKVLRGEGGLSLYSLKRVADALGCSSADLLAEAPAPGRRP